MIKFILTQGLAFLPGSVKYMPTLGFSIGVAVIVIPIGIRIDLKRYNARIDLRRGG